MNRDIVIETLTSIAPTVAESSISDDSNLLEQSIVDSGQFIELIARLEDYSGKEIDFLTVDLASIASVRGLTNTFRDL